jgi:hypothetical protein
MIANRPLRPFEQGAHLHVLDWAHETARIRFQAAGATQVKAAAKAVVAGRADATLQLPALEAAVLIQLRSLYALGHATVRSELDHQARRQSLPIGLSAAPTPPQLRQSKSKQRRCGTCVMFDHGSCWGYGNHPVQDDEVCDSWAREPAAKTLAVGDRLPDLADLRARAKLIAASTAHQIWQAVQRARLQGVQDPKTLRTVGRDAGAGALRQAASSHSGGAINAGRHAAATRIPPGAGYPGAPRAHVIGARYTSVLDKNTCPACAGADDGVLRALDDPALAPAPNPACAGGDRCRCIRVYQLSTETAPLPIAAGR